MKKVFIALALIASLSANAQKIHRNQWGLQPRVGISSFALWGILFNVESNLLDAAGVSEMDADDYSEFWARNSWYIPEIDFSYPIFSVSSKDGASLSRPYWWRDFLLWGDYSHTFKVSAGYELSWKSLTSPFGAFLGVDWEYSQIDLKDCSEAGKHRSQAVVPSAGLRFRLWGGSFERGIKPALEIGGSYVYHFKYHGPNDYDLEALNNGFRGKVALGVDFPKSHTAFLIEYEHEFFKYFNQDYETGGVKPFEGYKNTFGEVSLRISRSF